MARSQEQRERYEQHAFDLEGELRPPRRIYTQADVEALHEALEPFVDLAELRRIVTDKREVREALKTDVPPKAVRALMWAVVEMLRPVEREQIRTPRDAAAYFMAALGERDQEEFYTMALNTKNHVLGVHMIYKGSVNTAAIRVGEVFKEAIKLNAVGIICAHNHPSGVAEPSPEDILLTRQIVEAGKLLDIDCLDHIVVGRGRWVSLREKGMGFSS